MVVHLSYIDIIFFEIGEVDLLLKDSNGLNVLVEVEEIIRDEAISQILSLKNKLSEKNIRVDRMVLFGVDFESNILYSAEESGIEIWILRTHRIV